MRSAWKRAWTASLPFRPNSSPRAGSSISRRKSVRQIARIVGIDQQAAAGRLQQLGERAVPRLHHRHAVGQRLQHVQPLRLAVRRRHRQHVDPVQEPHLVGVARRIDVVEVVAQARLLQTVLNVVKILFMRLAQPAGDAQPAALAPGVGPQQSKRLGQDVQPFFRTDPGEVADRERPAVARRPRPTVAAQVQSRIDDVDALARDGQVLRHEVGVVAARSDEAVDLAAVFADQLERLRPERLRQRVEKNVVALERAEDRRPTMRFSSWTMPDRMALVRLTTCGLTSAASH